MIQIFLKKDKISELKWSECYDRIFKIVTEFPLPLERIESYNGFSKKINIAHSNLIENEGEPNECIAFWGDTVSFSRSEQVRFFKHWTHYLNRKNQESFDETKPLTWFAPEIFKNDGTLPESNGIELFSHYFDSGSHYRNAVLAVGIMLENTLPGVAFMIAMETENEEIEAVRLWLEHVFEEQFDKPLYFNKTLLLQILENHYDSKADLVGRLDVLYPKLYKNNMIYAIENIGYEASLNYYAQVLAHTWFGTLGFSEVFDAWIAATSDLEKALELTAESKKVLELDPEKQKEAEKYDYLYLLKLLLRNYVLWTPEQRRFLKQFYTNEQVLETGNEDLMGAMMTLSGLRFDICPVYATPEHLFEAFMYHDPKHGIKYKQEIDKWLKKRHNEYEKAVKAFNEIASERQEELEHIAKREHKKELETIELESKIEKYIQKKYPKHEHYFLRQALLSNPSYMNPKVAVTNLNKILIETAARSFDSISSFHNYEKSYKIKRIYQTIKEKGLFVDADFEKWINAEQDKWVITMLAALLFTKLYDRELAYARLFILNNEKSRNFWRPGQKFDYEDFVACNERQKNKPE